MDLRLMGKRAVILGGTRGIGRSIAETLAGEGADIALCARKAGQVREAVTVLKDKGVRAFGSSVDIMDGAALRGWVETVACDLGGIDILVSNAGAMAQGQSLEDWEMNFRLDVLGAVNAFQSAKPFLEKAAAENGDAAFVIIASVAAVQAQHASSYGPIKASLIHMAKGLARQYAAKKIRTNVVSPGMVYFTGGFWDRAETNNPEFLKQAMLRNPMGRAATPQEIANAAVFLASPASSYTTGVNLLVDGASSNRVNF